MTTIVLATHNQGKSKELQALFAKKFNDSSNYTILTLKDFPEIGDIPETGSTFLENALIKAKTVCQLTHSIAIADDSGLIVDALNGAPGVYSARYSAEENMPATDERNNAKLLKELNAIPFEQRTARFTSAIVAVAPNGTCIKAEGFWEGYIGLEPKGTNGFGYDPLFFDSVYKCHAAELSSEQKNVISHRAKALQQLLTLWSDFITKI